MLLGGYWWSRSTYRALHNIRMHFTHYFLHTYTTCMLWKTNWILPHFYRGQWTLNWTKNRVVTSPIDFTITFFFFLAFRLLRWRQYLSVLWNCYSHKVNHTCLVSWYLFTSSASSLLMDSVFIMPSIVSV